MQVGRADCLRGPSKNIIIFLIKQLTTYAQHQRVIYESHSTKVRSVKVGQGISQTSQTFTMGFGTLRPGSHGCFAATACKASGVSSPALRCLGASRKTSKNRKTANRWQQSRNVTSQMMLCCDPLGAQYRCGVAEEMPFGYNQDCCTSRSNSRVVQDFGMYKSHKITSRLFIT